MNIRLIALAAALAAGSVCAQPAPAPAPASASAPLAQSPQQMHQAKQPSPEEMRHIMDATMGSMVPIMGKMTEIMIDAQLRVAERPETGERVASYKRNLYLSLLKQGFSKAEALQITVNAALPSAAATGK